MARPPHKTGHPGCPYGSWAACDLAGARRFGQCTAMVGDREPRPCTRWAQDGSGWCTQHYLSQHDAALRMEREAARQLQLNANIDAYIERVRLHPSIWDGTRVPAGASVPQRVEHRQTRNAPFRLTEPA